MLLPLSCSYKKALHKSSNILHVVKRVYSSRTPQSVFIEKSLEQPAIILREEDDVDIIGPPDPVSNLRPIIRKVLKNESALQRRFREVANDTHNWNQEFWARHNSNFIKEKDTYIKENTTAEKPQLNADEMSEFYRDFLNKNWEMHTRYNLEWYGRNFSLLMLALGLLFPPFDAPKLGMLEAGSWNNLQQERNKLRTFVHDGSQI